jgi:hypothetical protein
MRMHVGLESVWLPLRIACRIIPESKYRFQRPAATTGTLLPAGFLCGIASALLIWRGTSRTKRTDLVEEKVRKAMSVKNPATRHTGNTMANDAHT